MTVDVETSIEIDAPRQDVAAFAQRFVMSTAKGPLPMKTTDALLDWFVN